MNNREFDNWLVGKISEVEHAYNNKDLIPPEQASWKHISSIISTHQVNSQFDEQLKSTLNDARVLDSKANWEQFQLKLHFIRERRNKIVGTRIAEVLVLLLLFWTMQSISDPIFNSTVKHPTVQITSLTESIEPKDRNISDVKINERNATSIDSKSKVSIANTNSNVKRFTKTRSTIKSHTQSGIVKVTNNKSQTSSNSENVSENSSINQVVKPLNENITPSSKSSNSFFDKGEEEVDNSKLPFKKSENLEDDNKSVNPNKSELIKSSEELNKLLPKDELISSNEPKLIENSSNRIIPRKTELVHRNFWMGVGFGVSGFQTNNTKFAPEFVHSKVNYQSTTYKNVFVNFDYEKWMINTGLKFIELVYTPGNYIDFNKFDESESVDQINNITYKMVEIPILLNRKIVNTQKWDLSGFGGLSIVMCNKANYTLSKITKNIDYPIYYDPYNKLNKLSYDYNYGISIDEVWKGNTYTNLLLGINSAYKLLDYFHLIANLSYSQMLEKSGFGPINNSFKNLNADFGVRYSFK